MALCTPAFWSRYGVPFVDLKWLCVQHGLYVCACQVCQLQGHAACSVHGARAQGDPSCKCSFESLHSLMLNQGLVQSVQMLSVLEKQIADSAAGPSLAAPLCAAACDAWLAEAAKQPPVLDAGRQPTTGGGSEEAVDSAAASPKAAAPAPRSPLTVAVVSLAGRLTAMIDTALQHLIQQLEVW